MYSWPAAEIVFLEVILGKVKGRIVSGARVMAGSGYCAVCCHDLVLTALRRLITAPGNLVTWKDAGHLRTDTVFPHFVTLLIAVALFGLSITLFA